MKKLVSITVLIFLSLSLVNAYKTKENDTIKIYSGDKTIIIVSKNKDSEKEDLEYGKKSFEEKIQQLNKSIDSLNSLIDSLNNLESDTSVERQKEKLQKEISEYQKMIDALEKGIKDIEIEITELDKATEESEKITEKQKIVVKKHKKFKGHWAGLEFGPNTFLTPNNVLIDNSTFSPLTPMINKSFEFSLNFLGNNVQIFHFLGLVSGLRLQWNNYKYETFPTYNSSYLLNLDSLMPINQNDGSTLKQVSLKTLNISIPILIELQMPFGNKNKFYVNFGGYAGLKINSKLKYNLELNGNKIKYKEDISKMILPYNYGLTARLGISEIQFFANYSLTPLFKDQANPKIYPISFGLHLDF